MTVRPRQRWLVAGPLVLLALVPAALLTGWAWRAAGRLDLTGRHESVVVYAAPRRLEAGVAIDAIDLPGTLRRLSYREVASAPREPGEFRRGHDAWELFLPAQDSPGPRGAPRRVRLSLENGRITAVIDAREGRVLAAIELEPEILRGSADAAGHLREPVALGRVPRHQVDAVLAAEDHRFFDHRGIDPRAVGRALWVNLRSREVVQGGSTLTQQLVKNLALSHRRTWDRKLREAALAIALEARVPKAAILETYLNVVYLGQHGSAAIHGIGAAARVYFGKDVAQLSVAEAALVAGMIRAPNTYSPVQNPARARERRQVVLGRMRALGLLDQATFERAAHEPVRVPTGVPTRSVAPYFLDYVRTRVEQSLGQASAPGRALRIYTTLDPVLQRAAEAALLRGLDRLETRFPRLRRGDGTRLQGALVALDAETGEVRALVGGRDYATSQWSRALHARRQPGSAFKPFVYLAALGPGPGGEAPHVSPVSRLEDRPLTLQQASEDWRPRNFEDRFEGPVTVRRALEQSLNAATVRLALDVGLERVIRAARAAGFTSPLVPVPALALGSFEVTPLELATAYASLARPGTPVSPTPIRAIVEDDDVIRPVADRVYATGIDPGAAFVLVHLLRGVVDRGTGAAARSLGVGGAVAGKTGTTNDGRDAWFVGVTPRLVALVWVGFDDGLGMHLSGGQGALPIWADFMRIAQAVVPGGDFPVPSSVTFRDVDPTSGQLATAFCPLTVREAFLSSTEPREACRDHRPVRLLAGWLRRLIEALR